MNNCNFHNLKQLQLLDIEQPEQLVLQRTAARVLAAKPKVVDCHASGTKNSCGCCAGCFQLDIEDTNEFTRRVNEFSCDCKPSAGAAQAHTDKIKQMLDFICFSLNSFYIYRSDYYVVSNCRSFSSAVSAEGTAAEGVGEATSSFRATKCAYF